jgi:hypothetical protein
MGSGWCLSQSSRCSRPCSWSTGGGGGCDDVPSSCMCSPENYEPANRRWAAGSSGRGRSCRRGARGSRGGAEIWGQPAGVRRSGHGAEWVWTCRPHSADLRDGDADELGERSRTAVEASYRGSITPRRPARRLHQRGIFDRRPRTGPPSSSTGGRRRQQSAMRLRRPTDLDRDDAWWRCGWHRVRRKGLR